ncbi:hypothetical protein ABZ820_22245 [Streptomyces diacarni]|uniref:hypothetical protein n=1 Tax=Streptomyces diacarni TaxID=2800381 RepID=UPI0033E4F394
MYSLTPGYRIPGLQRGLSPAESLVTKTNAGVGASLLTAAAITPPPVWTFGAVGAAAALVNCAPGPRSLARWAAVGYRRLRERTAPSGVFAQPGATVTWGLYLQHGTMQDDQRRAQFHAAFSRALTFAGGQARTAGVQVHVTHHATTGEYTDHTQTVSVHVPRSLGGGTRILDTMEGEFAALGALASYTPDPIPAVAEHGPGWVALEDGRYAATARITGWPEETTGDLMPKLLLGPGSAERSLGVIYRPLPAAHSRRSAKWQQAASEAFTTDKVKQASEGLASTATQASLVQGDALVDLDAYLTVWGQDPEDVVDARWQASLAADRHRIRLDWLAGQQHRAHVMTTPHGASTRKGTIL